LGFDKITTKHKERVRNGHSQKLLKNTSEHGFSSQFHCDRDSKVPALKGWQKTIADHPITNFDVFNAHTNWNWLGHGI
jgi:hypothetical protein